MSHEIRIVASDAVPPDTAFVMSEPTHEEVREAQELVRAGWTYCDAVATVLVRHRRVACIKFSRETTPTERSEP